MKYMMNKNRLFILLSLFLGVCVVGCSDSDDSGTYSEDYSDALISSFTLPANPKYAPGLANVFFSIDQKGIYEAGLGYIGQIYNADSLPMGTVTNSLLANITTQSASEVMLYNYNTETKEYSDSSLYSTTDSINFSHPVYVKVVAANRITTKYYEIKVNVHKQNPDSIDWQLYKNNVLPEFNNIVQQKAVSMSGDAYWFTATPTNVYLNKAGVNDMSSWNKSNVSWSTSGMLDLSTLTVYNDDIYCLTENGEMLKSSDGITFSQAMSNNTGFVNIIGSYGENGSANQLIAIRKTDNVNYFSYFTAGSGWVNNGVVPADFPIEGFSNSISYTAGKRDRITIAGGKTASGTLVKSLWSYDGVDPWAVFPQVYLPGAEGRTLVSYESDPRYKDTFWFMICGQTGANAYTSSIYYSDNKGVSWREASSLVSFPKSFEARAFVSAIVDEDFYINLLGGKTTGNKELNQIWKGRLNNLVFKPIE